VTEPSAEPPAPDLLAQLVHDLRQPLSVLRLLVDRALALDLPDDGAAVVRSIAEQVDEAVATARKISRLVE
jgi:signal transduction histidine kinase